MPGAATLAHFYCFYSVLNSFQSFFQDTQKTIESLKKGIQSMFTKVFLFVYAQLLAKLCRARLHEAGLSTNFKLTRSHLIWTDGLFD